MLRLHCGGNDLMCDEYSEWGLTRVNRTIVNVFFNNEQTIENGSIRKQAVKSFKSRQTLKRKYNEL